MRAIYTYASRIYRIGATSVYQCCAVMDLIQTTNVILHADGPDPTYTTKLILHLRIEMQIFSLHWMMQNIRLFNVSEARRASRRH